MSTIPPGSLSDEQAFLDSVEGEISFFRSIMRARPIGKHRHFNALLVRNAILRDTGRSVHIESIWEKLRKCYNLDALEAIEYEAETYHLLKPRLFMGTATSHATTTNSHSATPTSLRSPSPSENLSRHPFFQEEFSLPYDEFESLIAQRRIREPGSLPSSPAASPFDVSEGGGKPTSTRSSVGGSRRASAASSTTPAAAAASASASGITTRGVKRKLTKSKLNLAGLVGGDSDSSALTQESGDEASGDGNSAPLAETPRESVVTGTSTGTDADGKTEDGEDEDADMGDASPAREVSPKPTRGRGTKTASDRGRRGRGGAVAVIPRGTTTRGKKKQKR